MKQQDNALLYQLRKLSKLDIRYIQIEGFDPAGYHRSVPIRNNELIDVISKCFQKETTRIENMQPIDQEGN